MAAFEFGKVVCNVRDEIGVGSIRFAHNTVFIVAVIGALKPQRAVFLVSFSGILDGLNCFFYSTVFVKRAFEIIVVERDVERFKVAVLLISEVGNRVSADILEVIRVSGACNDAAVERLNIFFSQVIFSDIGDIESVIAVFGEYNILAQKFFSSCLNADGKIVDLNPGVVVIELCLA